ncbi:MAG TPA: kelch repeat-containing protein [Oscillospiraceae bacterium]|nr:kelch repeat-containing protein [Oscillospiraceae bacterium]
MKRKKLLKTSSIVLVLALLMSTILSAFADTTNTTTTINDSTDKWVARASMSTAKKLFNTVSANGEIYVIGGQTDNATSINSVEKYDYVNDKWIPKESMSKPRSNFQTAVIDNKIYAIGGDDACTMEQYDPATDKWTPKASMKINRHFFQVAVLDGKIYAVGGLDYFGDEYTSVEVYDPSTDKWTLRASMKIARAACCVAAVNGKLYALGGFHNNCTESSVEEYDPIADTWSITASMSTPRSFFQTQIIDDMIYAIGGNKAYPENSGVLNSVERFDTKNEKWDPCNSMVNARDNFQTTVVNGQIYVVGGHGSIPDSVEKYDPIANKWSTLPSLITGRCEFQTELINGKIYVFGGSNGKCLSSVEEYTAAQSPTLTVTPSSDKVKINDQFTTTVAIHKGTNICAEDIKLTYDTNLFEYLGAEAQTGLKIQKEDSTTTPGTIRFIVSCLGKDNAATGDKDLIALKFKAKKPGQGKVDITKGRIADNATLEMDVADADCGEATITVESNKDVNRSGDVTLLDLGIDSWYYGSDAKDTDSTKYDADVMPNGKIDDDDLSEITQGILSNSKYPNN